jgi:quinol monooxygenase YgiN
VIAKLPLADPLRGVGTRKDREERQMVTMFVRHTVSNYKAWRKIYDDFAPIQKAKGVKAQAVYQAADNPNDITVTHDFATREAAQAFVKSEELKKAMQNAGVVGAPTIWITNKA